MKQVVIENPVLNSPFEEPQRHFCLVGEATGDVCIERFEGKGPSPGQPLRLATNEREIAAARFFEISAEAVLSAATQGMG